MSESILIEEIEKVSDRSVKGAWILAAIIFSALAAATIVL